MAVAVVAVRVEAAVTAVAAVGPEVEVRAGAQAVGPEAVRVAEEAQAAVLVAPVGQVVGRAAGLAQGLAGQAAAPVGPGLGLAAVRREAGHPGLAPVAVSTA
jgi:hypothetical protein